MEATVAERGQITLPKAVRDALGLSKGTILKVELDGGRIILRKSVDDAISRARGRFKLDGFADTSEAMTTIRGRGPGDPGEAPGTPMIAIDTPALIDLLADGPDADAVELCLRQCLGSGPVVVCDVVLAELCSALKDGSEALAVLEEMSIRYLPTEAKSALRAGEMQRRHRQRGSGDVRAVPDFLTGAHALMQCNGLITRDDRFYRDYFKGLKLILPVA